LHASEWSAEAQTQFLGRAAPRCHQIVLFQEMRKFRLAELLINSLLQLAFLHVNVQLNKKSYYKACIFELNVLTF
jgi:hypothetical protein